MNRAAVRRLRRAVWPREEDVLVTSTRLLQLARDHFSDGGLEYVLLEVRNVLEGKSPRDVERLLATTVWTATAVLRVVDGPAERAAWHEANDEQIAAYRVEVGLPPEHGPAAEHTEGETNV